MKGLKNMNKELEEAKQKLKEFIGLFYEFPNPTSISMRDYEVQAIETVLQALENSIPKKKVEEKIEELGISDEDILIRHTLQELLEGK